MAIKLLNKYNSNPHNFQLKIRHHLDVFIGPGQEDNIIFFVI